MFKFLLKGILRDRHRSLLPIIVVALGVFLTVLMQTFITGILGDFIDLSARFTTGHVKIMSREYAKNKNQNPNDLALLETKELITSLEANHPDMEFVRRIRFGGLVDAPDDQGETRKQGTAVGLAADFLTPGSTEAQRLNMDKALVKGRLPENNGEILLSDGLATRLEVGPGDEVTLISSTMYGSMALYNFRIAGTVQFGIAVMDRGALIIDITSAELALDMDNAASEILGYFKTGKYDDVLAAAVTNTFNTAYENSDDKFAPEMVRLIDQNDLASMMEYMKVMIGFFIFIFVGAMSIVLWNAGLIGGLRRYGEIGVRLAIGEDKGHIYRSMIYESVLIGIIGTIIGTAIGLLLSWYLEVYGVDYSAFMKNVTMMIPTVFRAKISTFSYLIGFMPGLFSTVLGTTLSGIGIYRRQTAMLFKELEI